VKGMSPEYIAQRYNFSPDAAVTVIGRYVQNLAGRVKASFKEARGREPTLRDYWRVTDEQRLQRIEEMERAIRDTGDREMFDHLAAARYPELVAFARSYAAQNALAARLNSKEAAYRAIEKVLEVITHHEQSGIPRPPVSLDYFLSAVQAVYASKRIYRRRSDYGA